MRIREEQKQAEGQEEREQQRQAEGQEERE